MNLESFSSDSKFPHKPTVFLACPSCPGDLTVDDNEYTLSLLIDYNVLENRSLALYLHKMVSDNLPSV